MPNDNNKNSYGDFDDFNFDMSSNEDMSGSDENVGQKKKATKKKVKKAAKKKVVAKKTTNSKTAKKRVAKNSSTKKSVNKSLITSKKKTSKPVKISNKRINAETIEEELLKVTNIKSVEQVKKPRKIALMIAFYAVIVVAILVFCLIRFSKPKKNNLLLKESIDYEYLTEEATTTTERIIEESSKEYSDDKETQNRLLELTTKSINSYKATTEAEESTKKQETTAKEETTKKQETTKKTEETTKKQVETTVQITTKAWPSRAGVKDILPKFKEVIYDYPTYYQMSLDEIGMINAAISESYNAVKDNVFGESVSFSDKGANGLLYLNYAYLKEFTEGYTSNVKQGYDQLPVVPYYNYIMNDKFNFDYKSYTTNLKMKLNFRNAKNQGIYYEIPATVYEPTGSSVSANGTNKITVRVLRRAKVGYTESFSLTALLEVLDIECHTKHNPFFDIEDVIGTNPKAVTDMIESGFDVRSMIDDEIFNYVLFDRKGYITALYSLKS